MPSIVRLAAHLLGTFSTSRSHRVGAGTFSSFMACGISRPTWSGSSWQIRYIQVHIFRRISTTILKPRSRSARQVILQRNYRSLIRDPELRQTL